MTQENNRKKLIFSILGIIGVLACIGGVAYAIFNYTKTGGSNNVTVGKINFNSEASSIVLNGFTPISSQDALTDTTNVGTTTIHITGDTEYANGVEYLVTATDVNNTVNGKIIPIRIIATYQESENKDIVTEDSDYFTNRGGNSSIYKVLAGNTVTNNGELLVGYIKPDQTGIDGVLTIKAYVDEDDILVTNTNPGQTNKTVLTIEEWNSIKGNDALSFKIKVEANIGTWVDAISPTSTPTATPVPVICKPVVNDSDLNVEKCNSSSSSQGCRKSGYSVGADIKYGSVVTSDTYSVGNAFDCNVDGTGYNQRFYYLTTTDNKAVLISNTNFEGADGQQIGNNFVYDTALTKLPTTTQWSNLPTTFTHDNDQTVYAARFITLDEVKTAARTQNVTANNALDTVQFLFENTSYALASGGRSTIWIEEVVENNTTNRYRIHKNNVSVSQVAAGEINSSANCVRPVIEVPLNMFEAYVAPAVTPTPTPTVTPTPTPTATPIIYQVYTVSFDTEGGSANPSNMSVTANEKIGELPQNAPTKAGYAFRGWYTQANSGGTKLTENTVITGNITYHAQWDELVCMKATTLHSASGVTFGELPGNNNISGGFAYDCKVQTTGNHSERFYYLTTDDNGIAALIYYNNTHQNSGSLETICNADGLNYSSSITTGPLGSELPTTSQWDNVSLHSTPRQLLNENGTTVYGNDTLGTTSYTGKAARFATIQEIMEATGLSYSTVTANTGLKVSGDANRNMYLFENVKMLQPSGTSPDCRSNYWLESPKESGSSHVFRINGGASNQFNVGNQVGNSDKYSGTRPTIEVPTRLIEGAPVTYKVTFNSMGGSAVPSRRVVQDGTLGTLPSDPTKAGYTFAGWYTDYTDYDIEIDSTRVIHDDVTFYAKWEEASASTHTVTFNLDGGTMQDSTTRNINHGSNVGSLPTPTKTNYVFDGWYLVDEPNHSSTYSVYIEPTHVVNDDEEYIASWINDNYVAAIGSSYYETLTDAVGAITNSTPTTIRILKDISMTTVVSIPASRDITLDIGNHTITNTATNAFETNGILRIHDGTVKGTAAYGTVNVNGTGSLYVSGGTIQNTSTRQAVYNQGKLYISGDANLISSSNQRAAVHNNNDKSTNPRIEMSGGTVTASNASNERGAIQNEAGCTLIITGGTVTSNSTNANSGGIQNAGNLTIGAQNSSHNTSTPVIQGAKYGVNTSTNISFYDGILKGKTEAINDETKINGKESGTNKVNGVDGDYKTLYYEIISGYTLTLNANGGTGVPATVTIAEGAQVGQLQTPEKTGYIFEGWYLDETPAFQTLIIPTRTPAGAETYIAKWSQDVTNATLANSTISLTGIGPAVTDTISVTNASSIEAFTYSSPDPFTATVNSSGVVTAVAPGRTVVTLTGSRSNKTVQIPVVVNLDSNTPTFDIMPTAMRTYYDNINEWADGQTDVDHTKFDTAMANNLSTNNCINFNGDNRESVTSGTNFCDQPNQYDTGTTGTIKVYEYDYTNSVRGSEATYVTNNNGKLYNFIPGRVYYWEKDGDSSVNGKVFIYGERRIITIDNSPNDTLHQIRNVRDLGGIKVDTDGDGTIDGTIKYNKLYRGEKVWRGNSNTAADATNTQALFAKLGINHEMDLRKSTEPVTSNETTIGTLVLNDDNPSITNTYEIIHYELSYANDRSYYDLARKAAIDVMDEIIAAYNNNQDYSLYFHCRIGSDRTGTLAYILEGLLGVPTEERHRDYEMSVFFGIDERTRFYLKKSDSGSGLKKFIYMKNAMKASNQQGEENVLTWFLQANEGDSTLDAADMTRINNFRTAMIDYYS